MMNKLMYNELAKAEVSESRNIVISECISSSGSKTFTIAQQLEAKEDNGKNTIVFMKGAFHVDNIDGLYNLRNALNFAIQNIEEKEDTWDEE